MLHLLVALALTSPQHRHFTQKNLPPPVPRGGCSAQTGSVFTGWTPVESGVTSTLTANADTSPDCTVDATRVQFPAAVGGNFTTYFSPSVMCTLGANDVASIWVKGRTAGGQMSICIITIVGPTYDCTTVNFTTSWQKLSTATKTVAPSGASVGKVVLGLTDTFDAVNPSPTAAIDVMLWGASCT